VTRLALRLSDRHDWVKVFDPRGASIFVATEHPPAVGADVRIDLTIEEGGPRVILGGTVLWTRDRAEGTDPAGCAVGLSADDREKVNFLNGYVRGGLLNRRERRRLPLRLPVTYGGIDGPVASWTRDMNEEGLFIVTDAPLPEETILHFVVVVPGHDPLELRGMVSHTVIVEDEDVPGMGVRFLVDDAGAAELVAIVDELERDFMAGALGDEIIS
jgi:Tfp pilus assembly protein PilZ